MSERPPSALREIGGGGNRHRPLNGKDNFIYPMSRRNNQRQKQLQQATSKILEIARRNNLLRSPRYLTFVWEMQQNTDFSEQQLAYAWNQHFNSNKPTKAKRLEIQRQKNNRIAEERWNRKTRAATAHNPGRHTARHGSKKNANAMRTYRESKKPTPPKRERKGTRLS